MRGEIKTFRQVKQDILDEERRRKKLIYKHKKWVQERVKNE